MVTLDKTQPDWFPQGIPVLKRIKANSFLHYIIFGYLRYNYDILKTTSFHAFSIFTDMKFQYL